MANSIYDFEAFTITGENKSLSDYHGKVLLIVNVASNCGFTSQYAQLQELYMKYHDNGFEILAFPCNQFMNQEPGSNEDIMRFAREKYGVTFQMFAKIDVNGENAHPLYKYLTKDMMGYDKPKKIKWNFTKFLFDREGNFIQRYTPKTEPLTFEDKIAEILQA